MIHILNLEQHLRQSLWKYLPFFLHISKLRLYFSSLQSFIISKSIKWKCRLLQYVNKILLIPATSSNIFDKNCEKSSKFCNVFFNFVSFLPLSRSLVMTTFLKGNLQLFQCYNKMQNVIKKSLLCGCFSQKSKSLKCWIKWIAKYGLRFVKSEKIRFLTHRFSKIRAIKLPIFFLEICFRLT